MSIALKARCMIWLSYKRQYLRNTTYYGSNMWGGTKIQILIDQLLGGEGILAEVPAEEQETEAWWIITWTLWQAK